VEENACGGRIWLAVEEYDLRWQVKVRNKRWTDLKDMEKMDKWTGPYG